MTKGKAAKRAKGGDRADADPGGPAGSEALEISKLLVEILQIGYVPRHGGGDADGPTPALRQTAGGTATPLHPAGPGPGDPIASHTIRAAIHVYLNGPQTVGQLAAGLGISRGWASRVVDEMERAGYLERQRDTRDRRVVRVSLVPAAVDRVERAYRWRSDAVEQALDGMSPGRREAVLTFLARFVEAARTAG